MGRAERPVRNLLHHPGDRALSARPVNQMRAHWSHRAHL